MYNFFQYYIKLNKIFTTLLVPKNLFNHNSFINYSRLEYYIALHYCYSSIS